MDEGTAFPNLQGAADRLIRSRVLMCVPGRCRRVVGVNSPIGEE